MNELNRIKDIITKINKNEFVVNEQVFDIIGGILDLGSAAIDGVLNAASWLTNSAVPWVINALDNQKIFKAEPSKGDIVEVCDKISQIYTGFSNEKFNTDSDVYNLLIVLVNYINGVQKGSVTLEGNSLSNDVWLAMEILTIHLGVTFSGNDFTKQAYKNLISADKAEDIAELVSTKIKTIEKGISLSSEASSALDTLSEFFVSGIGSYWGGVFREDRLNGEWDYGSIKAAITSLKVNINDSKEAELNEFEQKFVSKFECGSSILKKMKTYYNDEKQIWFGIIEEKGYKILIKEKDGEFYGSIQHNGKKVALIHHFDCSGKNSYAADDERLNVDLDDKEEPLGVDLNEQASEETNYRYQPIVGTNFTMVMTPSQYEKIKAHDQYAGDSEEQPEEEPTPETTVDDTTPAPETTVDDTEKDVEPTPEEKPKSNIEKLIEVLIQNGYNERAAQSASARAVEGSIAVSNYLGRIVTQKEYELKEEDYFAEIFMKSVLEGKTKFRKGSDMSSHDKKAKEEERIIKTTVDIEQPTEMEKRKIEELGSDADALDSKNTLLFDKKRIKSIRLTSDNSTVIYIANEDISDIVSDIERSIEKTFGGDWYLDKGGNKYLTKNKIFIFKKKN